MDPPPALPMTGRRKSCVLPNAGPLMRTIRPFVPGSTAPAAAGQGERRGEGESDAQRAAHHLANLTRGGAQKRA